MTNRWISWGACAILTLGMACTPALNWREVRFESSNASVLMPCKPDQGSRTISLQANEQEAPASLQLYGCEANDMQFTLGQIILPLGVSAAEAMQAWQQASLVPLNATSSDTTSDAFALKGALPLPPPMRRRLKNTTHQVQWVWWARGNAIYQVAVYGNAKNKAFDDTAELYFSGIKLP